ncbi:hypothetical protein ACIQUQ_11045 [Streptomyces sp. NPDC101118]|uniref:hypothetical protein n=1 Tax=Streptomyces sp. NPDC101118 TaxID=3366109 RepID=UPI0038160212
MKHGSRRLVGSLVAGALAAAPGTAYAAPEPVPSYVPRPGAEAVEGGASTANGPELRAGRTYEDTLPVGTERFYRVELDGKSSVYVSATVRPKADAKVKYGDGVDVVLMDTGGKECTSSGAVTFGGDQARPLADLAVRRLEEDGDCQAAGTYYVKVTRETDKESDQGEWPMELQVVREPGLAGGNAPTTGPSAYPSAPVSAPGGAPVKRAGGTGFNDARAVGKGVYTADIRPGQTLFYRVPVDWGQQLSVDVELSDAQMTKDSGYASYGLISEVYTPVRNLVHSTNDTYSGKQLRLPLGPLAPVAYENRFSDNSDMRQLRSAGWHYLAVTLNQKVGEFTTGSVPLTLRVKLTGQAAQGPAYAEPEQATKAGFGLTDEDRAAADAGQTAIEASEAADSRATMRIVAAGGIGAGTVLLLWLGGWTLLARRRAAA